MADDLSPFQAFELAVSIAKGQSNFARIVGCTPGNISQLLKKRSSLPGRFVLKAEAGTGVLRHSLRPDLYPLDHAGGVSTETIKVACDRTPILDRGAHV